MCLAIPGRITRIEEGSGLERHGTLDIGGIEREVNLAMVPEAEVGDHVIIHSGFALRVTPPPEADHLQIGIDQET